MKMPSYFAHNDGCRCSDADEKFETLCDLTRVVKAALDAGRQAESELQMIDAVLARRPALADCGSRREKIELACFTAGQATDQVTRLERALAANDAEIARLTVTLDAMRGQSIEQCARADTAEMITGEISREVERDKERSRRDDPR